MNTTEIITLVVAYVSAITGALLVGFAIATIEGWLETRRLRKFAKSTNLKARPRWFKSGPSDL
jgi:hypothetical protein